MQTEDKTHRQLVQLGCLKTKHLQRDIWQGQQFQTTVNENWIYRFRIAISHGTVLTFMGVRSRYWS